MGSIRKNIEAPGVADVFVTREPDISFFGDKADQQDDHGGDAQSKGGEQHKPVTEGVGYPDGSDRLIRWSKRGLRPQLDGVEEHSIKIPAHQAKGDVNGKFSFVTVDPRPALFGQLVLQLLQIDGWAEHRQHLLSL